MVIPAYALRNLALRTLSLLLLALAACAAPAAPAWRPLFNGSDLSGWVPVNVAPSTFTARDGLIVCTGQPTGVLRTDRMYENFILELEWRHLQPGGNAGLFVWSDPLPARGVPFTRSLEVQVMDGVETPDYTSDGDIFSIWGARFVPDRPHPSGWERCLPSERRARPAPEWNHYRVSCRDGVIELEVNGAKVSGGTQAAPRKGYLCLESEGSEVHFRNLKILELAPSEPPLPTELVADEARGRTRLFDGLELDGWRLTDGGSPDPAHWQVRDGKLWTDGRGGDLACDLPGGSFELQFDWRRAGEGSPHVPIDAPIAAFDVPEVAAEGWHRVILENRAIPHHAIGSVKLLLDDRVERRLELPRYSADPHALHLHADGHETEFANLFVSKR
jgi:hypothetical protein